MNDDINACKLHSRVPAKVSLVKVNNPGPGHCGRCGCAQMADFKEQTHARCEGDAFITGQGQNLSDKIFKVIILP